MDTYYEDILKKVETLMKDAQFAEAYEIGRASCRERV
mgnify:CR=1 FL=1